MTIRILIIVCFALLGGFALYHAKYGLALVLVIAGAVLMYFEDEYRRWISRDG